MAHGSNLQRLQARFRNEFEDEILDNRGGLDPLCYVLIERDDPGDFGLPCISPKRLSVRRHSDCDANENDERKTIGNDGVVDFLGCPRSESR